MHQIGLFLGGVATIATFLAAVYRLYRWLSNPARRHVGAATALLEEGKNRARVGEVERAMELYDLSIRLNPDTGHVYYLRGLLHERNENLARAIADWRRSLDRIAANNPGRTKADAIRCATLRRVRSLPMGLRVLRLWFGPYRGAPRYIRQG